MTSRNRCSQRLMQIAASLDDGAHHARCAGARSGASRPSAARACPHQAARQQVFVTALCNTPTIVTRRPVIARHHLARFASYGKRSVDASDASRHGNLRGHVDRAGFGGFVNGVSHVQRQAGCSFLRTHWAVDAQGVIMSIQLGLLLVLFVAVGVVFGWTHRAAAPTAGMIAHAADPVSSAADERR